MLWVWQINNSQLTIKTLFSILFSCRIIFFITWLSNRVAVNKLFYYLIRSSLTPGDCLLLWAKFQHLKTGLIFTPRGCSVYPVQCNYTYSNKSPTYKSGNIFFLLHQHYFLIIWQNVYKKDSAGAESRGHEKDDGQANF